MRGLQALGDRHPLFPSPFLPPYSSWAPNSTPQTLRDVLAVWIPTATSIMSNVIPPAFTSACPGIDRKTSSLAGRQPYGDAPSATTYVSYRAEILSGYLILSLMGALGRPLGRLLRHAYFVLATWQLYVHSTSFSTPDTCYQRGYLCRARQDFQLEVDMLSLPFTRKSVCELADLAMPCHLPAYVGDHPPPLVILVPSFPSASCCDDSGHLWLAATLHMHC
jgi:hypothetical protein